MPTAFDELAKKAGAKPTASTQAGAFDKLLKRAMTVEYGSPRKGTQTAGDMFAVRPTDDEVARTYQKNQCGVYTRKILQNNFGWAGGSIYDVRNPKYAQKVEQAVPGDVVYLKGPEHWALVFQDDKGNLRLNELVTNPKTGAFSVNQARMLSDVQDRISGVYRPKIKMPTPGISAGTPQSAGREQSMQALGPIRLDRARTNIAGLLEGAASGATFGLAKPDLGGDPGARMAGDVATSIGTMAIAGPLGKAIAGHMGGAFGKLAGKAASRLGVPIAKGATKLAGIEESLSAGKAGKALVDIAKGAGSLATPAGALRLGATAHTTTALTEPVTEWARSGVEDTREIDGIKDLMPAVERAVKRGWLSGHMAKNLALGNLQEVAKDVKAQEDLEASRGYREFMESKGWGPTLKAWAADPLTITTELVTESLAMLAPAMPTAGVAGGAAAKAGALAQKTAAGMVAGSQSGLVETAWDILSSYAEEGIDVNDPNALKEAFSDRGKYARIRNRAVRNNIPIALFDTVSVMVAGGLYGRAGQSIASKVAHAGGELLVQGGLGGGGEVAKGIVSGEGSSAPEVWAEVIAEIAGPGPIEAAYGIMADVRAKNAAKPPTTADRAREAVMSPEWAQMWQEAQRKPAPVPDAKVAPDIQPQMTPAAKPEPLPKPTQEIPAQVQAPEPVVETPDIPTTSIKRQEILDAFRTRIQSPVPGAHEKNTDALLSVIDSWEYSTILHPDNKNARAIFEEFTGISLPSTVAGTRDVFKQAKPDFTIDNVPAVVTDDQTPDKPRPPAPAPELRESARQKPGASRVYEDAVTQEQIAAGFIEDLEREVSDVYKRVSAEEDVVYDDRNPAHVLAMDSGLIDAKFGGLLWVSTAPIHEVLPLHIGDVDTELANILSERWNDLTDEQLSTLEEIIDNPAGKVDQQGDVIAPVGRLPQDSLKYLRTGIIAEKSRRGIDTPAVDKLTPSMFDKSDVDFGATNRQVTTPEAPKVPDPSQIPDQAPEPEVKPITPESEEAILKQRVELVKSNYDSAVKNQDKWTQTRQESKTKVDDLRTAFNEVKESDMPNKQARLDDIRDDILDAQDDYKYANQGYSRAETEVKRLKSELADAKAKLKQFTSTKDQAPEAPPTVETPEPSGMPGFDAAVKAQGERIRAADEARAQEQEPKQGMPGLTVTRDSEYINLKFDKKPDSETLRRIKALGFRWSSQQQRWYGKATPEREALANSLTGTPQVAQAPEPQQTRRYTELELIDTYNKANPADGDWSSWGISSRFDYIEKIVRPIARKLISARNNGDGWATAKELAAAGASNDTISQTGPIARDLGAQIAWDSYGNPYYALLETPLRQGLSKDVTGEVEPTPTPQAAPQTDEENYPEQVKVLRASMVAPHMAIAKEISERLMLDQVSWQQLFELADREFGGSMASGAYDARDVYDAMEVAVNQTIATEAPDIMSWETEDALNYLRGLTAKLPTQTTRTETQIELQQFSTPPVEAYVAAKALGNVKGLHALEPSAGTGSLANFLRLGGAIVDVNEFPGEGGTVRAALLSEQGFAVMRVDAERIDAFHPSITMNQKPMYDVILMNPPFSATGGRVKAHKTKFGRQHVESALRLLSPEGRLVAIVGGGMGEHTEGHGDWFKSMAKQFGYRANLLIDGSEYAKYGTTFDNRILVFDGKTDSDVTRGPLAQAMDPLKSDKPIKLDDAAQRLEVLARERAYQPVSQATGTIAQPTDIEAISKDTSTRTDVDRPSTTDVVEPSTTGIGDGGKRSGSDTEPGGRTDSGPSVDGRTDRGVPIRTESAPVQSPADVDDSAGVTPGGPEPGSVPETELEGRKPESTDVDLRDDSDRRVVNADPTADDTSSELATFEAYKPKIDIGNEHPAVLVETGSMRSIPGPLAYISAEEALKNLHIPDSRLKAGALSNAQLEAVILAEIRHQHTMLDGYRLGMWVGDGTGAGKGREIAGVITNNFHQGNKRSVWISTGQQLVVDARRDMKNVAGQDVIPVTKLSTFKVDQPIDLDEGCLFVTYGSLSKAGTGTQRLAQIVQWLNAGGGQPVIAIDESHKAQNAVTADAREDPSKIGVAIMELQGMLKDARMVYATATAADNVQQMGYMTRLGLWGSGTPFATFNHFASFVRSGGVTIMELMARDLKAIGAYVSRSLAFAHPDGTPITYREHTIQPNSIMTQQYNKAADVWSDVLNRVQDYVTRGELNPNETNRFLTHYWGAHQRFFKNLFAAFAVQEMIGMIDNDLALNKSVVILLDSTNEGKMREKVAAGELAGMDLDEIDFSNKDVLPQFIAGAFPLQLTQEVTDENGHTTWLPVWRNDDGNVVIQRTPEAGWVAVEDPAKVRLRDEMLSSIDELSIPGNPLDQFVLRFGDQVAEITGREKQLYIDEDGRTKLRPRGTHEKLIREFNSGKRRIAIVSRSGAQGISLHAGTDFKNQQQRMTYLFDLSWQTKDMIQMCGRTHRSDQVIGPEYILVSMAIGGSVRFSSALASRLAHLGAIQRGDRSAAGAGALEKYDFNSEQGANAIYAVMQDLEQEDKLRMGLIRSGQQISGPVIDGTPDQMLRKFFNRLMVLPVKRQNEVFDMFMLAFEKQVMLAKQEGTLDTGIKEYKAESMEIVQENVVARDRATGAETSYIHIKAKQKADKVSYKDVKDMFAFYDDPELIVRNESGRVAAAIEVLDFRQGVGEHKMRLTFPNSNTALITKEELRDKWTAVPKDQRKAVWNEAYKAVPDFRTENVHIIGGLVLPIIDRISGFPKPIMLRHEGRRIIGMRVSHNEAAKTKANLGLMTNENYKDASSVYELAAGMLHGETISLADDVTIRRTILRNEPALHVTKGYGVLTVETQKLFDSYGLISIVQGFNEQYYIPMDSEKGPEVTGKLIERFPVVKAPGMTEQAKPASTGQQVLNFNTGETLYAPRVNRIKHRPGEVATKAADIIKMLSESIAVIRHGRIRGRAFVRGRFKVRDEVIRIRQANDLQAALHETAHAIHKTLWGVDTKTEGRIIDNSSIPREYARVLHQFLPDSVKDNKTIEGFAEFFRMWMTEPDKIPDNTKDFVKFFEKALTPQKEMSRVLRTAKSMIEGFYSQSPEAVMDSLISVDPPKRGHTLPPVANTYQELVNSLYSMELMEREMAGKILPAEQSPSKTARRARGVTGKAEEWIWHDITDSTGKPIAPGLRKRIEEIPDIQELRRVAIAWNFLETAEHWGPEAYPHGVTEEMCTEIVYSADQVYRDAVEALTGYEDYCLSELVDSGLITEGQKNAYRERYPHHVPLNRELPTDWAQAKSWRAGNYANLSSPIRQRKTSGLDVIDPLQSIIRNTYMQLHMAEFNRVMVKLYEMSKAYEGTGWIVEEVPRHFDKTEVTLMDLFEDDDLIELVELGLDPAEVHTIWTMNSNLTGKDRQEHVIRVYIDGTAHLLKLDPLLYNAVTGMSVPELDYLFALMKFPNDMLRTGVVLHPEFSLWRNPLADSIQAMLFSNHNIMPWDLLRGFFHAIKGDHLYHQWRAMGGANVSMVSPGRQVIARDVRKFRTYGQGASGKVIDIEQNPRDALMAMHESLRGVLERLDAGPRLAEFGKATKWGAETDTNALMEAILDSRDLTIDFLRAGRTGRKLNLAWAFLNPAVQGADKFARSLNRQTWARTVFKAMVLFVVPTIMLYQRCRDDDRYEELDERARDLYWHIPTPAGLVRIRRPFEPGIIYAAATERLCRWVDGKDPDVWDNLASYGESVKEIFLPSALPTILVPIFEVASNRSFLGRPIVPRREADLPKELQYGPNTTEVAKILGEVFKASPRQVDHIIRGWGGTIGGDIAKGASKALTATGIRKTPPKPANVRGSIPIVRTMFTSETASPDAVNKLYKELDKLRKARKYADSGRGVFTEVNEARLAELNARSIALSGQRKLVRDIMGAWTLSEIEEALKLFGIQMPPGDIHQVKARLMKQLAAEQIHIIRGEMRSTSFVDERYNQYKRYSRGNRESTTGEGAGGLWKW